MSGKCRDFAGDMNLVIFNLKITKTLYPASATLLEGLIGNAPTTLDCNDIDIKTFESELQNKEKIFTPYQTLVKSAIATARTNALKKSTITCIKGKVIKKVPAVNPKCPAGYKKN